MVIIQLAGGLGNQMFQYALYLQLKSLGKAVKIDDVSGFVEDRQREPALAPFGADYERVTRAELEEMLDSSPLLHAKIRRKLCGRKKKAYFEADKRYKPEIMEWDDIYLEGYWQTEKYFYGVSEEVKKVFDTDKLLQYMEGRSLANDRKAVNAASRARTMYGWLEQITMTESVSVHVRRGDYLLPENQELFGNICTEEYYYAAMEQMMKQHPGCVFYLFTNDKQWAEGWIADFGKHFNFGRNREAGKLTNVGKTGKAAGKAEAYDESAQIEIVGLDDIPDDGMDKDYAEFILMSRCRHNILANSSFSWWASYLNRNPHKTVLVPDRWLNGWNCEDFYRADMKKLVTKAC